MRKEKNRKEQSIYERDVENKDLNALLDNIIDCAEGDKNYETIILGKYEAQLLKNYLNGLNANFLCFHCSSKNVIWDNDFDLADYIEEEGVVHNLHCENCGANIYCGVKNERRF